MSGKLLRALVTLLLGIFLVTMASGGAAAPAAKLVSLKLNDRPLTTKGLLEDSATMVPLRSLADELNFTITIPDADPDLRAIVTKGSKKIELRHKSSSALVNGHEIPIWPTAYRGDDGQMMVPLRFLLENMGYQVCWLCDPTNTVEFRPLLENDLIISTVRERLETATLSIDIQYPKILGLASSEVQETMNTYFAARVEGPRAQAFELEKENVANGQSGRPTELVCNYIVNFNQRGILSITFDDYMYTGGAHGGTVRSSYTVDLDTGRTYSLKDLFASGADYVALLNDRVKEDALFRGRT